MPSYSDERTHKGYTTVVHEVHAKNDAADCDACHLAMWDAIDAGRDVEEIEAAGNDAVPSWAKFGSVSVHPPESAL
jgi:hypothetical protein